MNRLLMAAVIISLSASLGAAPPNPVPNPPLSVSIANQPVDVTLDDQPIAVTLPDQPIDVTVGNLPAVQAVEDVDNPAFQPFAAEASNFTEIDELTVLFTGAKVEPVPEGKRLIVQFLSMSISSSGMEGDAICRARVLTAEPFDEFGHYLTPQEYASGDRTYQQASTPLTLYADAGQEVGVACSVRTSADTLMSVSVSGYFIDVES